MENCKFHKEKEAVTKCKICGAKLCEECENVQEKYKACPKCAKKQLLYQYSNLKRQLLYVYLALACLLVDIVLFVTEIFISSSITNAYMIGSIVFISIFTPFCMWLLISRLLKVKKVKELIKLAEREDVGVDDKDKKTAENFENSVKNDENIGKNQ